MYRLTLITLITLLTLTCTTNISAQPQNVKEAIDLIVLFCVAGGERFDISSSTKLEGGIALKKFGASGEEDINISKSEAKGLVDGLRQEMGKVTAEQASEARSCMKPYIDRILNIILGAQDREMIPTRVRASIVVRAQDYLRQQSGNVEWSGPKAPDTLHVQDNSVRN